MTEGFSSSESVGLPAMQATPLPEDRAAQAALEHKLGHLALPPQLGRATSPLAADLSGRTYVFEKNEQDVDAITLSPVKADKPKPEHQRDIRSPTNQLGDFVHASNCLCRLRLPSQLLNLVVEALLRYSIQTEST